MCRPEWRRARTQAHRLQRLELLRRVRDRIRREPSQPLDVADLAQHADLPVKDLCREFQLAYGQSLTDRRGRGRR